MFLASLDEHTIPKIRDHHYDEQGYSMMETFCLPKLEGNTVRVANPRTMKYRRILRVEEQAQLRHKQVDIMSRGQKSFPWEENDSKSAFDTYPSICDYRDSNALSFFRKDRQGQKSCIVSLQVCFMQQSRMGEQLPKKPGALEARDARDKIDPHLWLTPFEPLPEK